MATIIGTNGNNILNGTASTDTIIGLAGNDQLLANGGNDRLNGGVGNDVLNGGLGIDTADYSNLLIGGTTYIGATAGVTVNLNLTGAQNTKGAGSDTLLSIENLIGTNFNDALAGNGVTNVLSGLAGNDIVAGAAGNDQLVGGDGNDLLNGGVGNDLLNGGSGVDTADYGTFIIGGQAVPGATAGVTVNLNLTGAQNTGGAGTDTLVSIENLTGSNFNDTLTGSSANNVLTGRTGNDTLLGSLGNDTLQGDSGNDTLNGGAGIDTASYTTATAGVTVGLGGGTQNTGGAGIDTLVDIENLIGSNFNDTLTGPSNDDGSTLNGGLGNDSLSAAFSFGNLTLNGGAGNDGLFGHFSHFSRLNGDEGDDSLFVIDSDRTTLNGGAGNDSLVGWDSSDMMLNGGAGNDQLYADAGHSTMNGGAGADSLSHSGEKGDTVTFEYSIVSDSPAGAGKDIINRFTGADGELGDQIDLTAIDANTLVSGNQAFQWKGATPGGAGTLWYAGGVLNGNVDGDAAAEFQIQLVGGPVLFVNPASAGTDILL
jgi:Ca2+-binding RTX toxin-like protein